MTGFERLWKEMETNLGERSYGLLRRRLTTERDDGLFVGIDPASGQRLFLVDLPQGIDFANRRLRGGPRFKLNALFSNHILCGCG